MSVNTITFIVIFTVFEVNFSTSNNAGSVTFERLELQVPKNSKYY